MLAFQPHQLCHMHLTLTQDAYKLFLLCSTCLCHYFLHCGFIFSPLQRYGTLLMFSKIVHPAIFQFKIALWHCNNCNWTPSNPPSDDLYRQNAAQIASRSAGSAYQPIYTATFWPKRLTRSPSKWHEMVFESVEYNLTA